MNKKGFSLVELIVVIAIMAVLLGVIAPSLFVQVENARAQRDTSAMSEVGSAIRNGMLKDPVYDEALLLVNSDGIITLLFSPKNGIVYFGETENLGEKMRDELRSVIGDSVKLSSRTYKSGEYDYQVIIDMNFPGAHVSYDWVKHS